MKEIEAESAASTKSIKKAFSDDDAILVEAGGPAVNDRGSIKKKKNKK
jgi:translocation protein SEC66